MRAIADIATHGEGVAWWVCEAVERSALNTRVVIEQAKGVLAERGRLDMDEAFVQLRHHNLRLSDLARAIVESRTDLHAVLDPPNR